MGYSILMNATMERPNLKQQIRFAENDAVSHLVLDQDGNVVDRCVGHSAALRAVDFRHKATLQPHFIQPAR